MGHMYTATAPGAAASSEEVMMTADAARDGGAPALQVRRNEDGDGFVTAVTMESGWLMELHLLEEPAPARGSYELRLDVRSAFGTMDGLRTVDVRKIAKALVALADRAEVWGGKAAPGTQRKTQA